jgi:uncharacterized membrane protein
VKRSLATAAGLGVVSGLRTLQGLAWLSRYLSHRRRLPRHATVVERWLAHKAVARALATGAGFEIAGDKHPRAPDRIHPSGLLPRALAGAVVGMVAAGRGREAAGAAMGAGGAVAGAFAGWFLRREFGRVSFLPDAAIALAEDALAVALARRLVGR